MLIHSKIDICYYIHFRVGKNQLFRRRAVFARQRRFFGKIGSVLQTGPPASQCQYCQQRKPDKREMVPEVW